MIKVEIELDEQKIREDNKYVPESIMDILDNAFASRNQPILEADGFRRVYRDSGDPERDFGILGGLVFELSKKEWFLPYAKSIVWSDNEDSEDEAVFFEENWLDYFKKNRIGAYELCRD